MMSTSNLENIPPNIVKVVSREIGELLSRPLPGIRIKENEGSLSDIRAVISGPDGTPFEGGEFQVKLVLGKEFPALPPKAYFLTTIFHPNVAKNGEICVSTLKRDWSPNLGIGQILLAIRCLLICPNPESALNEEAGKLLLTDYGEFSTRARMMTEVHAKPLVKPANVTPLKKVTKAEAEMSKISNVSFLKSQRRSLKRL